MDLEALKAVLLRRVDEYYAEFSEPYPYRTLVIQHATLSLRRGVPIMELLETHPALAVVTRRHGGRTVWPKRVWDGLSAADRYQHVHNQITARRGRPPKLEAIGDGGTVSRLTDIPAFFPPRKTSD